MPNTMLILWIEHLASDPRGEFQLHPFSGGAAITDIGLSQALSSRAGIILRMDLVGQAGLQDVLLEFDITPATIDRLNLQVVGPVDGHHPFDAADHLQSAWVVKAVTGQVQDAIIAEPGLEALEQIITVLVARDGTGQVRGAALDETAMWSNDRDPGTAVPIRHAVIDPFDLMFTEVLEISVFHWILSAHASAL